MTQPTIITADSETYLPTNNSGTDRLFSNVSIPASCNTFMVTLAAGTSESNVTWTDVTFNGVGAVKLHQIDVSGSDTDVRATVAAIFDTSSIGAVTGTIEGTLNVASTISCLAGVVCTTGYLESFSTSNDRVSRNGQNVSFSNNYANNISVLMGSLDRDPATFVVSAGTLIYADKPGALAAPVCWAIYQDTNDLNNQKTIAYDAAIEAVAEISMLISSQANAFSGGGAEVGPVIKHNVIT
jgi:hypothetical protein